MGTSIKISVIGAGSGQFSLGIVRDLCQIKSLWGSTVSFMDINEERLNAVYNVATRFASELGVDLTFEKTLNRKESLQGADFVINSAMVIGWTDRGVMQGIARKHDYRSIINLNHFLQLHLFMSIIHDMEAICPNAWYIQSANPVFDGCTLITRQSSIKTVGLCHGFDGGIRNIAAVLGLDPEEIEAQAYGINHNIWLTKFFYRGRNAYPILDEWIEKKAEDYWASQEYRPSGEMGPKAVHVYKRLGLFPVGDTVTPGGGSHFRWYHTDQKEQEKWGEDPAYWWSEYISKVSRQANDFVRIAADPSIKVTGYFPTEKTKETNVSIIDALVNDKPDILQVNIPNRGSIPGIAGDVGVEIPALVSGAGIQGLVMSDLPKRILFHLQESIIQMERCLEAYISRDKEMLIEVILACRQTNTIEQATGVLEELMSLREYHDLAKHFGYS